MYTHRPCLIMVSSPPPLLPSPHHPSPCTSPPIIHTPYPHLIPHPLHRLILISTLHPCPSIASPLQCLISPTSHPSTPPSLNIFTLHPAQGYPEELVDLRPLQLFRAEEDLAGSTAPQIRLLLRYEMIAIKVKS